MPARHLIGIRAITPTDSTPHPRPRPHPFVGLLAEPLQLLLLMLVVGAPIAAALAAMWAASIAAITLRENATTQLAIYEANLRGELERHAAVPLALTRDSDVVELLQGPDPERVSRMNRKLEELATTLGASALYVMDHSGLTLAASNWNTATSFVGQNFAYRPYFRMAIGSGEGHHFALGTTSFVPGFYTAHRVMAENHTLGAVVLKVGFERLERTWRLGPDKVVVTDRDGMVFITTEESWRYHALPRRLPLSLPSTPEPAREETPNLPWAFGGGSDRIAVREDGAERRYLLLSAAVPGGDWTLHTLTGIAPVAERAQLAGLLGAAIAALAGLAAYAVAQRRASLAERLAVQETARIELERRVAEATAELREAENELTQAVKLAALGQMSAGIAHEINQPLTAIRSFADNAVVLLDRGRPEAVRDNLTEIAGLTDRMAAITRQLKGFARRASGTLSPVQVNAAVEQAVGLLGSRLRRDDVTVETDLPDDPVWATGEDVRLQQVLVNLIGNAADAVRGRPQRLVRIVLTCSGDGEAILSVRDTGTGIRESDLPRLFVPFFTTKEAGEGLGLGLSISHGIVEEFGGSLTAANHPDGGAIFTLRLKRAEQTVR